VIGTRLRPRRHRICCSWFLMVKDEAGAGRLNVVLNAFADLVK
jgi:hypothetical protein